MKNYQSLSVFLLVSALFIAGCLGQTANIPKARGELRPASDYEFEMRKTTKADVIARLGTADKRETDKDGYETLMYKVPRPTGKLLKYTVHSYTFTKKGLLTGHGKHGSSE